jgi:hypothetical protein
VFRAEIDGRPLTFFHTNMVGMNFTFADSQTRTRWQQETGEAIDGPLKGRRLQIYPFLLTTWKEWRERHPRTLVMVPVPGLEELYAQMWQTILARRPGVQGPPPERTLRPEDPRLAAYEPIVGVEVSGSRRAYPIAALAKERVVNDLLGGEPVLIVYVPETDTVTAFSRTVDGRTLTFNPAAGSPLLTDAETGARWNSYGECVSGNARGTQLKSIVGVRQFWWSWAAFFPDTDVYQGKGLAPR